MEDSRISRRAFLKKFVILSMLSVAEGCMPEPQPEYGVEPLPEPEYGMEPVALNQVSQITYLDENGGEKALYESADVPTSAQFIIHFSDSMDKSSQSAVLLRDMNNNAPGFESSWSLGETALRIIPRAILQYATRYTLEVGEGAKTLRGEPLQLTGAERAEFTTVES